MNDFTIADLQVLLNAVEHYLGDYAGNNIKEKLKYAIENYCDLCPSAHSFYEKLVCDDCGLIEDL